MESISSLTPYYVGSSPYASERMNEFFAISIFNMIEGYHYAAIRDWCLKKRHKRSYKGPVTWQACNNLDYLLYWGLIFNPVSATYLKVEYQ